jgi:Methyltransferase domain
MKVVLEYGYLKSALGNIGKGPVEIIPYHPERLETPRRVLDVRSSWRGIESVLADVIKTFHIKPGRCLEFGVEFGYSTVALSSFFDTVTGVDTFVGDKHTGVHRDLYTETVEKLKQYENISLVRSDYRDWIKSDNSRYDLIHVDIIHTYTDTFTCGLWAARHSRCAIFHDTESFRAVKMAVADICRQTDKSFYNFSDSFGLGIIV